jgi:dATP pyrophosphohydrolase
MARAPFQVLVIPYRQRADGRHEFAVLHRADGSMWQFIAGGGENDETPADAAVREASEEACIPHGLPWIRLDSVASIPRTAFPGANWPSKIYVVPEYCFAVNVSGHDLKLSDEHHSFEWLDYEQAWQRLTWQSNQTALWELRERLRQASG